MPALLPVISPTCHPASPSFCFVEIALAHGVISGYSDGTFRPGNNATRGQICKIVYNAIVPLKEIGPCALLGQIIMLGLHKCWAT